MLIADHQFQYHIMKLKKRKIKYAGIFLLCWLTLLVFLVDGILNFQTLVDYFGSYGRRGKSPWIAPIPLTKYLSTTEHKERQVVDTMHLRT